MRSIATLLLVIVTSVLAYSQSQVNPVVGQMGIEIPIFTLSEGNLSVPITVGYDASGIKTDATASNVGLNWQLNAGGFIARDVRGHADETQTVSWKIGAYYGYMHNGLPADDRFAIVRDYEPDLFTIVLNKLTVRFWLKKVTDAANNTKIVGVLLNKDTDITIEGISDPIIDYPNCPSFTLDEMIYNYGANSQLASFLVTTADGVKYYFGKELVAREYAFQMGAILNTDPNIRGTMLTNHAFPIRWYLSRIDYPNGQCAETPPNFNLNTDLSQASATCTPVAYQTVSFTYERTLQRINSPTFNKPSFTVRQGEFNTCVNVPKRVQAIPSNEEATYLYGSQLKRISGVNLEVIINDPSLPNPDNAASIVPDYEAGAITKIARVDAPAVTPIEFINRRQVLCSQGPVIVTDNFTLAGAASEALANIVLRDKISQKKQAFFFQHDYFKEFDYDNSNARRYGTEGYRLALRGIFPVLFKNSGGVDLQPGYTFVYNGKNLPTPYTLARDHWGYYNGSDANKIAGFGYWPGGTASIPLCDAAGSYTPTLLATLQGSLRYMKFPTGGVETYTYDNHDAGNYTETVGGLRLKEKELVEPISGKRTITRYSYRLSDVTNAPSSGYLAICPFAQILKAYVVRGSTSFETTIDPNIYATFLSRFTLGNYISYSRVREETFAKESVSSSEVSTGYVVYDYLSGQSISLQTCTGTASTTLNSCLPNFIVSGATGYVSARPLPVYEFWKLYPKEINYYKPTGGTPVRTERFKYAFTDLSDCEGFPASLMMSPMRLDFSTTGAIPDFVVSAVNYGGTAAGFFSNPVGTALSILGGVLKIINNLTSSPDDNSSYTFRTYRAPISQTRLLEKSTTSSENGSSIELVTSYAYNTSHTQPTQIRTFNRTYAVSGNPVDGPVLTEQLVKYIPEYTIPTAATYPDVIGMRMAQKLNVVAPVESVVKRNGRVISGQYTSFNSEGPALPAKVYGLEINAPLSGFTMASFGASQVVIDPAYREQQSFLYNSKGLVSNIQSPYSNGGKTILYETANYNGLLPKTVSFVSTAQEVNYTYETALWGPTRETTLNGGYVKTEYDNLGRIIATRDHNNNLRKSYQYAFAAPTPVSTTVPISIILPSQNAQPLSEADASFVNSQVGQLPTDINITLANPADAVEFEIKLGTIVYKRSLTQTAINNVWSLLAGSGEPLYLTNGSFSCTVKAYYQGVISAYRTVRFSITN